ncbi:DUF2127 domain-containing protein [Rhodobacter xanthinilyticus]|nr:DUF2127 domain-containing protein [Rhodobacter xanthinilyticus]
MSSPTAAPIEMRARLARAAHWAFEASLAAKGALAAAEAASGLVLLALPGGALAHLAQRLTAHELSEDPRDHLANALLHGAEALSVDARGFYAAYFLSHGLLKLAVVALLARGVLWAYPAAVALLSAFILYQLHRYALAPDPAMLWLSALDLVVIALTVQEWRRRHAG